MGIKIDRNYFFVVESDPPPRTDVEFAIMGRADALGHILVVVQLISVLVCLQIS